MAQLRETWSEDIADEYTEKLIVHLRHDHGYEDYEDMPDSDYDLDEEDTESLLALHNDDHLAWPNTGTPVAGHEHEHGFDPVWNVYIIEDV